MEYTIRQSKIHKHLIKIATFWIPRRSWRKNARYFLKDTILQNPAIAISIMAQDLLLFDKLSSTKSLIVFLVPEHNAISGGIFSFFSLAKQSRTLKNIHGSDVIVATIPNKRGETYFRQTYFRNEENVYRFEQITKFKNLTNLVLHMPEYFSPLFFSSLNKKQIDFINNIPEIKINILNQNTLLMPQPSQLSVLRRITDKITLTAAHQRYATQEHADQYKIPVMFLPAFTDLSLYPPSNFEDKQDLIIYSPDKNEMKEDILKIIAKELPKYELKEIKNISFDEYMELATKAKFAITFGEGYDGYLAQPLYQGGVSFAVYNDDFFPSRDFLDFSNTFSDYEDMKENIVKIISKLEKNSQEYAETNRNIVKVMKVVDNYEHYINCIKRFYLDDFDFYPAQ